MNSSAWSSGSFFGASSLNIYIDNAVTRVSQSEIQFNVTGIFSIVFVLYAAVPGHYLNSVLLSSAETFSPFAMSVLSEVAN